MELKNFYRLIFTNSQEYFVKSEINDVEKFKESLLSSSIVDTVRRVTKDCFQLQLNDTTDPVLIMYDKLFSVQPVKPGYISPQSKVWRLV